MVTKARPWPNPRASASLDAIEPASTEPVNGEVLTGETLADRLRDVPDAGDIGAHLVDLIHERDETDSQLSFMRQELGHMRQFLRQLGALRARTTDEGQEAIAKRMGTSQSAVARLESGAVDPRVSTLVRYLAALGLQLTWRPSRLSENVDADETKRPLEVFSHSDQIHMGGRKSPPAAALLDLALAESDKEIRIFLVKVAGEVARAQVADFLRGVVLEPGVDSETKAAAIEAMRSPFESTHS